MHPGWVWSAFPPEWDGIDRNPIQDLHIFVDATSSVRAGVKCTENTYNTIKQH